MQERKECDKVEQVLHSERDTKKTEKEGRMSEMEDTAAMYGSFAAVYDMFMDNIPYEEWCEYLVSLLREQGVTEGILADLGCGTGSLTELLSQKGYDMIGIDLSEEMLEIAMNKRIESQSNILYLLQDMREIELYGTVRAIVSICDSMNYLTEYEDLVQTLRLANLYLDPKGVFIFDMNTEYKYREILADNTIAENREESSFIWENQYDEESRLNEYDLTLFIREDLLGGEASASYRRFQETHYQRAYSLEEIQKAIAEAGMELLAIYDAFTKNPPRKDSERIYVIARECGK